MLSRFSDFLPKLRAAESLLICLAKLLAYSDHMTVMKVGKKIKMRCLSTNVYNLWLHSLGLTLTHTVKTKTKNFLALPYMELQL